MSNLSPLLLIILISFNVTACNIGVEKETPARSAQEWINGVANLEGIDILKNTCNAERDNVQQSSVWVTAFTFLGQRLTGDSFQLQGDVSELKFETLSETDTEAVVKVSGDLYISILGTAEVQRVDEHWRMVKEDGHWRWCGPSVGGPSQAAVRSASEIATEVPGVSNIAGGTKLTVVNITYTPAVNKPGWNRVVMELARENVTEYVNYGPWDYCGEMIDTSGNVRIVESFREENQWSNFLPPKTRLKNIKLLSILPVDQQPQSMSLQPVNPLGVWGCTQMQVIGDEKWVFSTVKEVDDALQYPYDNMPNIAPTALNNVMEYEVPGIYKIRIENCRFKSDSSNYKSLSCDYTLQNTGANDIQLVNLRGRMERLKDIQHVLMVMGVSSTGRSFHAELTSDRVGPTITHTESEYLEGFSSLGLDEWFYIALQPLNHSQPVAQMIVNVRSN